MKSNSNNAYAAGSAVSSTPSQALPNFISSNIRLLRKRNGWSQQELAERVGLNRGNIASYESSTAEPKICKLLRISQLFGLSSRDFTRNDLSIPGEVERAMKSYQQEEKAGKDRVDVALDRLDEYTEMSKSLKKLHNFKVTTLSEKSGHDLQVLTNYMDQLQELNDKIASDYRQLLEKLRCHC